MLGRFLNLNKMKNTKTPETHNLDAQMSSNSF